MTFWSPLWDSGDRSHQNVDAGYRFCFLLAHPFISKFTVGETERGLHWCPWWTILWANFRCRSVSDSVFAHGVRAEQKLLDDFWWKCTAEVQILTKSVVDSGFAHGVRAEQKLLDDFWWKCRFYNLRCRFDKESHKFRPDVY